MPYHLATAVYVNCIYVNADCDILLNIKFITDSTFLKEVPCKVALYTAYYGKRIITQAHVTGEA